MRVPIPAAGKMAAIRFMFEAALFPYAFLGGVANIKVYLKPV
jgi:hypothetical protein